MLFTIMKMNYTNFMCLWLLWRFYIINLGTFTIIFIGTGEFNIAPSFNSYTILIQFLYSWARLLALHMYMYVPAPGWLEFHQLAAADHDPLVPWSLDSQCWDHPCVQQGRPGIRLWILRLMKLWKVTNHICNTQTTQTQNFTVSQHHHQQA